jgi:hypothetical protein
MEYHLQKVAQTSQDVIAIVMSVVDLLIKDAAVRLIALTKHQTSLHQLAVTDSVLAEAVLGNRVDKTNRGSILWRMGIEPFFFQKE